MPEISTYMYSIPKDPPQTSYILCIAPLHKVDR